VYHDKARDTWVYHDKARDTWVYHDKARDTWANIVGRQCRLSFWRPTVGPDSRPERKRKRILVITSYFVQYKNEKPHNFSKETTLATIINTMRYIYSYRYMCFVGYDCINMLTSKKSPHKKNRSRWTRDWIARCPVINVRNLTTTKCHSFLRK